MSDQLKHECGVAVVRLRKELGYYQDKYGNSLWGFDKLFLLMEKQHNRGQDGVGIGCNKLGMELGQPYVFRRRSNEPDGLKEVFEKELKEYSKLIRKGIIKKGDPDSVKRHFNFGGEVLIGHLRYGTAGGYDRGSCHPYLRRSSWPTRTLMVMGNFNMTNTAELRQVLIDRGQHPVFGTDTQTVLEEIGFYLDETHTDLYRDLRDKGVPGREIPKIISERLDVAELMRQAADGWDGGYAICGVIGNGDLFALRDPRGIRPCHMLVNDEVIAIASERVPLMTAFEASTEEISEILPGEVVTVKADGELRREEFAPRQKFSPCSFERIYFSRGNDPAIYRERKALGKALVPQVQKSIEETRGRAVFSFIPNTAEIAWYGLMEGLREQRRKEVREQLKQALASGKLDDELLDDLVMRNWPRGEKIAHKDVKLRTFITKDKDRKQLVDHVYDITYGVVGEQDALVVLDDSIVRGTTLRVSILKILARTNPAKIVICSTAPQIRYPDCYGIHMTELDSFVAFQAAVRLLHRQGRQRLLAEVNEACRAELAKPEEQRGNPVQRIYDPFTPEQLAEEISAMIRPEEGVWEGKIEVIFLTIENLHLALGDHSGDWYFTGKYPTPGGFTKVNQCYMDWYQHTGNEQSALPF